MTSKSEWYDPDRKVEEKEVEFKQEVQGVPYEKEEVEDEVLEAVEEAKDEVPEMIQESVVLKDKIPPIEVLKEINEAPPKPKKAQVVVRDLRKNDDAHNRTCACCMKRLPIEKFPRHKRSEVCEDCE